MESHDERIARIEKADAAERKKEFTLALKEELLNRSQAESLSVEGMGFKGSITSQHLVYVVLGILLSLAIAWMIRDHDLRSAERTNSTKAQSAEMKEEIKKLSEVVSEGNYIQLQDEQTRRAMAARIAMPEGLRAKMDRGGR